MQKPVIIMVIINFIAIWMVRFAVVSLVSLVVVIIVHARVEMPKKNTCENRRSQLLKGFLCQYGAS